MAVVFNKLRPLKLYQFAGVFKQQMQLSSAYRILPYSMSCDTLFLSFSRYYHARHHHCSDLQDVLPILKQNCQTYKIVILADSLEQGRDLVAKIRQRQQLSKDEDLANKNKEYETMPYQEEVNSFNRDNLLETIQKSSFLHLKSLINQTENRITALTVEVASKKFKLQKQKSVNQGEKQRSKQLKIKQKCLQSLKDRRSKIDHQINRRNVRTQLKEELNQDLLRMSDDQNEEYNEDEYLLSDCT